MRTILAALDQSRLAESVVDTAAKISQLIRANLTILSVIGYDPTRIVSVDDERNRLVKFHRELIFKHFPKQQITAEPGGSEGTVFTYRPDGIKIRSAVAAGNPADSICTIAGQIKADLVVLGNRGIGNVGVAILGSVSEKVVRNCPTSVLVVKGQLLDDSDWEAIASGHRASQGFAAN